MLHSSQIPNVPAATLFEMNQHRDLQWGSRLELRAGEVVQLWQGPSAFFDSITLGPVGAPVLPDCVGPLHKLSHS